MTRPRLTALALVVGLSGCGAVDGVPRAPQVGEPLPELAFATLSGDSLSLGALDGRPTLVNVWATWCPPCRAEIPFLQSIHEEYEARGLRVVGISADNAGALDQVQDFLAEAGVTYENALDPRGTTMDAFRLLGLPATYLLDAEGRVALVRAGPVSETDRSFMEAIEALVATGDGA